MIRIKARQTAEPVYIDSIIHMWTNGTELRFLCVGDADDNYHVARFDACIEAETAAEMIWRKHADISPETISQYLAKKHSL